jgi:hypothetical protein
MKAQVRLLILCQVGYLYLSISLKSFNEKAWAFSLRSVHSVAALLPR